MKAFFAFVAILSLVVLFGYFKNIYNIFEHYPDKIGQYSIPQGVCVAGIFVPPLGAACGVFNVGVNK